MIIAQTAFGTELESYPKIINTKIIMQATVLDTTAVAVMSR